jgi:hypothetical protein
MICNYHWLLDTVTKRQLVEVYNKLDQHRSMDRNLLRSCFDREKFKNS